MDELVKLWLVSYDKTNSAALLIQSLLCPHLFRKAVINL